MDPRYPAYLSAWELTWGLGWEGLAGLAGITATTCWGLTQALKCYLERGRIEVGPRWVAFGPAAISVGLGAYFFVGCSDIFMSYGMSNYWPMFPIILWKALEFPQLGVPPTALILGVYWLADRRRRQDEMAGRTL
jgi:hypothetical protein